MLNSLLLLDRLSVSFLNRREWNTRPDRCLRKGNGRVHFDEKSLLSQDLNVHFDFFIN